jgi:hypothetical protein
VAATELVSPANKDRQTHRRAVAVKCARYLQDGISVIIVDVVTERHANLHTDLLDFLNLSVSTPDQGPDDLYAAAYRPLIAADQSGVELWVESLAVGSRLPTLPLWIADLALPFSLEESHVAACAARRIELP